MQRSQSRKTSLARSASIGLLLTAILFGTMGPSCDSLAFRATFANSLIGNSFETPGLSLMEGIIAGFWADDIENYFSDCGDSGDSGDAGGV